MSKIDWEKKYKQLKIFFLRNIDIAYYMGYEAGYKDGVTLMKEEMYKANVDMMGRLSPAIASLLHRSGADQGISTTPEELIAARIAEGDKGEGDKGGGDSINPFDQLININQDNNLGQKMAFSQNSNNLYANRHSILNDLEQLEKTIQEQTLKVKKLRDFVKRTQLKLEGLETTLNAQLSEDQKRNVYSQEYMVKEILNKWRQQADQAKDNIINELSNYIQFNMPDNKNDNT